ncbi:GNAT family N-acetyltransferase [Enterococcus sp. LJL128]
MRRGIFETERIYFSHWQEKDSELAVSLWGNQRVVQYITKEGMSDAQIKERLAKEIENQKAYGYQYWPIFLKRNEAFIGCAGLRPYAKEGNAAEIGVHLKEEFWGQGFAEEALREVIQQAASFFMLNQVFAGHHPANTGSKKLLNKLGFVFEKTEFYEPTGLCHPLYFLKL